MNNKACKRVLAIHDLSGFGHTSLMAVIPLLYKLGIRVCALPTAILSANTDFAEPCWVDMSPQLQGFARHWQDLGLHFDAIYSGFLSSSSQAEQVGRIIHDLRNDDTLVLVDPVMADNGKLYSCFDGSIIPAMQALISRADIITPNITELALLAGRELLPASSSAEVQTWCQALRASGPRHIVVTSVPTHINVTSVSANIDAPSFPNTSDQELSTLHYDTQQDTFSAYPYAQIPGVHPGAGDCFSTLLLAGLVNGFSLDSSLRAAVKIMSRAMSEPIPADTDPREGIALEEVLAWDLHSYYRT